MTRSDTNQAVQLQKMARGLKIWIKEEEGLYYSCSENKGADQLRGYSEADLRLCFRINVGFLMTRLICAHLWRVIVLKKDTSSPLLSHG